jgi:fido (protein-threonine AMPylation protein)
MPLLTAGDDKAEARRLQRLAKQGRLRRIYAGIYTDDLAQPLETVVRRELLALCALIAPGAILSHRSALESSRTTAAGNVFLTGSQRRDFKLPGVTLRMTIGAGPLESDIRVPTLSGDVFIASQPRALLENLSESRGDPAERRTAGAEFVEAWLDRFISRDLGDGINKLRDAARAVAEPLGLQKELSRLDTIIGTLLGTRTSRLHAPTALARAAGRPYDDTRVALFQTLAEELQREPLQVPEAGPKADSNLQAFVETYFSNYIEGTEFELEEAHDIVVNGRPLQYREDDSHDILGTYRAILKSKSDPSVPQDFVAFATQLREWNASVIESRHAKNPGEFKMQVNRAGNTVFVAPELVIGTLGKGFEIIMSAVTPANRAALAAFVVAEVHPFSDGNGRTARLAMNLYLSAAGLTRVIIPTVYRDDYISALKAMSSNAHPVPLVRMLARAAQFSRWIDFGSQAAAFAALKKSMALERPEAAKLVY